MLPYEIDHIQQLRTIAPECMDLLRYDGTFPLTSPGEVAL